MLDKRYGLRYSMPHSIVHIVDNSMYNGELPTIVTDDPSIYSTIVVTGSPMGIDNEIVNLTRSDVLNVAYDMGNVSPVDIKKYGQSITYPADLINQNVPVKLLRVTPEGSTYAFSCLLMQWKIENNTIRLRYKVSDDVVANGIPAGKVLANFKNPKRLHDAFMNGIDKKYVDDDGEWEQRVFMTFISAGRGSAYNKFAYTINPVQQTRRPANIKYLFTTYDTLNNTTVEKFFASIFNENNDSRPDALDPLNVIIGQRVPGSSILIPTMNEDAVRELYNVYMSLLKYNIDNQVYKNLVINDSEYYTDIYAKLNLNIFDPIFGRYIYNGDSDVSLPFLQVEMVSTDIPRLPVSNIIETTIDVQSDWSEENIANEYKKIINSPVEIYEKILNESTVSGIYDSDNNTYKIGNVYLNDKTSPVLYMTTTINQFTGAVTNIPIYQVYDADNNDKKESLVYIVDITNIATGSTDQDKIKSAVRKQLTKYTPEKKSDGSYKPDFIIYVNNVTFGIAKVSYSATLSATSTTNNVDVSDVKLFTGENTIQTKKNMYGLFVYPNTTISYFAYKEGQTYYTKLGSTIINAGSTAVDDEKTDPIVYINGYDYGKENPRSSSDNNYVKIPIITENPFIFGKAPSVVKVASQLNGIQYDLQVSLGGSYILKEGIEKEAVVADIPPERQGYADHQIVTLVDDPNVRYIVDRVDKVTENNNTRITSMVVVPNTESIFSTIPTEGYHEITNGYTEDLITNGEPFASIPLENITFVEGKYYTKNNQGSTPVYTVIDSEAWDDSAKQYYYKLGNPNETDSSKYIYIPAYVPDFATTEGKSIYIKLEVSTGSYRYFKVNSIPADWDSKYDTDYISADTINDGDITAADIGTGAKIYINPRTDIRVSAMDILYQPYGIKRYEVSGPIGSLYNYGSVQQSIPSNYYTSDYGRNPVSEVGGIYIDHGSTGFFDDDIDDIVFKWKYSELLVKAYKGLIDPRIKSPTRCPAKYLFDGGTNTIIGQTILPYMTYSPSDIIYASTIFTDEEKEAIQLNEDLIKEYIPTYDQTIGIDVKQAMYDLMEYRCYYGLPEDKRPVGPGSGLSLHLDSGITSASTSLLMNQSFIKRFVNPNASWDIGGFTSIRDGITYTYTKQIVQNLFTHMRQYSINKPFVGKYTSIKADEYTAFFPDIDTTDWEERELYYNSGGNSWIMDVNGNIQRRSQRSLYREGDTSDLIQENNMRTLSLLVYLLQNKIDTYLLEYNDDGVLKTLKDDVDNMFTNWVGNLVQALDIRFERDINPYDGGEIVVCYCDVTFRGLILRVPIIVNIQRRES